MIGPAVCGVFGNLNMTVPAFGQVSFSGALHCARTSVGVVKPRLLTTGSKRWQPMSPRLPVPKSSQLHHFFGWYAPGPHGRCCATPSQRSQWTCAGGFCGFGRPLLLHARSAQVWTALTLPMAPW